ncbi:MAG: aspartyl/asparaginyl beta-hydroxylase protein [Verrucomicrobiaceae bacterium]|nr:aspartyl/asparaginyl beta-hydroxylase protein [Verrucomicrobiaceae bacterium]
MQTTSFKGHENLLDRRFETSPGRVSEKTAFTPEDHAQGRLPLAAYDRTHRIQPATSFWGKVGDGLQDLVERWMMPFSIPGDCPVFSNRHFAWVDEVEAEWTGVREELDHVMQYRDQMPSFQDIVKEVGTIQSDDQWKTFFLKGVGMDCEENARRCPKTMKLLEKVPKVSTAFFSILSPGKHIPSHRGAWAGILRLHLGLLVPEPREKVRIRVANQMCQWSEGKCLIFDDTWNHEVWNDTDGYRVVLFVDFERPLELPWRWINHLVMNLAPLAPFLREAKGREKSWAEKMWGGKK